MRILYLDIDSLRAAHLGCYEFSCLTSPHLDALVRASSLLEWQLEAASDLGKCGFETRGLAGGDLPAWFLLFRLARASRDDTRLQLADSRQGGLLELVRQLGLVECAAVLVSADRCGMLRELKVYGDRHATDAVEAGSAQVTWAVCRLGLVSGQLGGNLPLMAAANARRSRRPKPRLSRASELTP